MEGIAVEEPQNPRIHILHLTAFWVQSDFSSLELGCFPPLLLSLAYSKLDCVDWMLLRRDLILDGNKCLEHWN